MINNEGRKEAAWMAFDEDKNLSDFNENSKPFDSSLVRIIPKDCDNTDNALSKNDKVIAKINVSSHEEKSTNRSNLQIPQTFNTNSDINDLTVDFEKDKVSNSQTLKTGKLLTTVFPINQHCAWVTLPYYDSTKMPNILSHEQIKFSPAVYSQVIKTITQDMRFLGYCALYSRILPIWLFLSVFVLLVVLFSTSNGGFPILIVAFIWLFMLLLGIFFCIIIRKHLAYALRQTIKEANRLTLPNNLLVGVQDRGQISCFKTVILFIYYEIGGCRKNVAQLIQVHKTNSINAYITKKIDFMLENSKILPKFSKTLINDEKASLLSFQIILDHTQQYVKSYMKKQLLFPTRPIEGVSNFRPKHCAKSYCLCQYIEKEFFDCQVKRPWYEHFK